MRLFQSLGRDSGGWDPQGPPQHIRAMPSFNPSVGIQVVGTLAAVIARPGHGKFQSLGRDSGGWDGPHGLVSWAGRFGFNPSVGIQVVGTSASTGWP